MYWGNRNLVGYNAPPTNIYNDPSLLEEARYSINNYNSGHFRQLVFYALRLNNIDVVQELIFRNCILILTMYCLLNFVALIPLTIHLPTPIMAKTL